WGRTVRLRSATCKRKASGVQRKIRKGLMLNLIRGKRMATEKQIAANRANAKRSTGPKTLAVKLRSSRNAYRHGLTCPSPFDPLQVDAFAQALVAGKADDQRLPAAAELAQAQLDLLRIRSVRS